MERLYKELGRKIAFIGISGDSKEEIGTFMKEYNLTFPVAHDQANIVSGIFHVRIPAHILIDAAGIVRYSEPEAPADIWKYLKDAPG